MTTRNYSSRSQQTTLTSAVTAGASTMVVQSGTALLGGQSIPAGTTFTIVVDPDTAIEEIVDATAVSTNTFTITRAIDGSSAQAHSAGAVVRHMAIGRDYREANTHIEASTGVHGISNSSSVVGTTDTQTLTNKTLTSPTITNPSISGAGVDASIVFEGATADAYETTLTVVDPTQDNTITMPNTTGTVVIATAVQTLTNKTLGGNLNAGGYTVTNLATPVNASDAVRKDFADAQVAAAATSAASASTSAASAATSASSALTSANSASASATAAATSAASAATSASTMAASVAAAAASATQAATSATSAAASATAAATSATSAAASATAASTSATSASASATAAATSATSAAASATASANSASASATSATASASSASAAATSASSAATSASSAATSVTAAETAWDTFDDRYLGPKSTAPTVDNDGNPLTSGVIYWNTTDGNMYAYNGSAWVVFTSSGDITGVTAGTGLSGGGTSGAVTVSLDTSSVYVVPSQTGNAGKFLITDGTNSSWSTTVLGTFVSNSASGDADSARNISLQIDGTTYGRILVPTGSGGAMAFWTGATPAERMRIDSAGAITAAGSATFGTVNVTSTTSSTNGMFLPAANTLDITTNSTRAIRINSTQQVGIGMTPTTTLDITGTNVRLNPTNVATNGFIFNGSSSNTNWASMQSFRTAIDGTTRFETLGSGITGIGGASGSAQLFVTNITASNVGTIIKGAASQTGDLLQVQDSAATALVRIDSAGKVGIGAAPTYKLDVYSATGDTVGRLRAASSGAGLLYLQGSNSTYSAYNAIKSLDDTNTQQWYIGGNGTANTITFQTISTERMRIDASGNTTINSIADATTTTAARGGGYMGIPQSAAAGSGAYTVVAADAGEHIYTTTTRTVTIPANASVAFPVGTVLSFISGVGATTTIAITSDTMYLAGTGTTGSRTLAAHGMATAVKVASTTWYISGNGLT